MSLEKWVNSSYIHRENWLHISASPTSKVTKILDSTEEVFQVAVIKDQNKPNRPVFFKPETRIDSPFEDMFVRANLWLREFNRDDFIPANIGWDDEAHVCRARHHIWNKGYNSYLLWRP